MVAAHVEDSAEGKTWILAEVVSYNHNTSKYEIDDILKEQNQKGRHTLSRRRVIPLPLMRANPETDPQALFPQGTLGIYREKNVYLNINKKCLTPFKLIKNISGFPFTMFLPFLSNNFNLSHKYLNLAYVPRRMNIIFFISY